MKFEEAIIELRKGRSIRVHNSPDYTLVWEKNYAVDARTHVSADWICLFLDCEWDVLEDPVEVEAARLFKIWREAQDRPDSWIAGLQPGSFSNGFRAMAKDRLGVK